MGSKRKKKKFPSHIEEKAHFPPSHHRQVRGSEENHWFACGCAKMCQTQA